MNTYKLSKTSIIRLSDNAIIPLDPANSDYVQYLAWEELGNSADPIDTIPQSVFITQFVKQIDTDVDYIYDAVVGSRTSEYALAESDARYYVNASYAGVVPNSVQALADAKAWPAAKAADDIISKASAWKAVQVEVRAKRLAAKEKTKTSTSEATLEIIKTDWSNFLVAIKSQLGI